MKVSSPIGDLPFEPRSVRIRNGGIRIDGVMGAWPATVQVTAADVPALSRLLAKPAITAAAAAITLAGLVTAIRTTTRTNS
ncbi:hypothetical protein [Mycolicibacterium tokaiense]|uniref:Uncharacterized protein n=1 Tax=Mycolicibacterium tokaiense TaxID=39695 RepID=A0A378TE21_9MYCO|nr:hypothetical protein [Mycolicibacterium tokaiense]BBY86615.1 hypothetical protein MTOK_23970 [Mycolicibacterium tokaiense]STZ58880.1 Uncharacterised protein [Mycolicibacterium tokaiense]